MQNLEITRKSVFPNTLNQVSGFHMSSSQKLYLLSLVILLSPLQLFCQKTISKKIFSKDPQSQYKGENVLSWHVNLDSEKTGQLISVSDQLITFQGISHNILALPEGFIKTKFAQDGSGICILSTKNLQNDRDKMLTLQFYSDRAELIFELNQKHVYDEPIPEVFVFNENRGFLLGNNAVGKLWFYDNQGRLENEIDLFPGAKFDLERILSIDASGDTRLIAVLATRRSASPMDSGVPNPSGEPTLFVFSNDGNEIWSRSLSEMAGGEVAVSPSGQYMLASSYSTDSRGGLRRVTTLFDSKGEQIQTFDFLFQTTSFSFSDTVLLMADRQTVKAVQLQSGKQEWQYKIKRQDGLITAVQIGKELQTSLILVAKDVFKNGAFVFVKPKLMVLNRLGKSIQTLDFPEREFVNPALFTSPGAETVGLGFRDAFLTFNVNQ